MKRGKTYFVYRSSFKSEISSIVHVRSAGFYDKNMPVVSKHIIKKYFLELFWCVRGVLRFRHKGQEWLLRAGEVCFYFPGDVHELSAVSADCEHYWMALDGPYVSTIIEAFKLRRGPRKVGPCPAELFSQLYELMNGTTLQSEYLAGACAFEILTRTVMGEATTYSGIVQDFLDIVEKNYWDSSWDINAICEKMGVHRATLYRKVLAELGRLPSAYLTSFRLQKALELLQQKKWKIEEIAQRTGFNSANYFAKVFRHNLGVAPKDIGSGFHAPILELRRNVIPEPPNLSGVSALDKLDEPLNHQV